MNIIKLYGGLGNQMFQYAFGKLLKSNGFEVRYNTSLLRHPHLREKTRNFMLDKFYVEMELGDFLRQRIIRERQFNPSVLLLSECNFLGYWQRSELYKDLIPALKKEFCVKERYYTPEYLELKKKSLMKNLFQYMCAGVIIWLLVHLMFCH
jgi:hypothetical protein